MRLFTYWRSSASYRVRIALGLKGLDCTHEPVHLVRDGGEQHKPAYLSRNPQALVPALELDDGQVLTQSLAIMDYLEEAYPTPPLLPADAVGRARVRGLAQAIACEIHPLNNLRVLGYLGQSLGADADQRAAWYRHWVGLGLTAVESMLAGSPETGRFCHGETPGLADCCLVPQLYNARRFDCDLDAFPTVLRIEAACLALPAVRAAAPEAQPDAE
jgi:maleylacetoacetate isomerase